MTTSWRTRRARWLGALAGLVAALSSCLPSTPNTTIGVRLEEQVLVAVIPGCARTLEAARVLLYSADPAHGPRVIWESGGEVDLGATEDEFREVRLDAATFPASHGSYEALLRGEVEISEDSSWLEVQVDPRGAVTFGQVPIYDIDALGTGGEGVWHGSSGPVPPEKIGMSPTELCSD